MPKEKCDKNTNSKAKMEYWKLFQTMKKLQKSDNEWQVYVWVLTSGN